jgi:hypothetical protein
MISLLPRFTWLSLAMAIPWSPLYAADPLVMNLWPGEAPGPKIPTGEEGDTTTSEDAQKTESVTAR